MPSKVATLDHCLLVMAAASSSAEACLRRSSSFITSTRLISSLGLDLLINLLPGLPSAPGSRNGFVVHAKKRRGRNDARDHCVAIRYLPLVSSGQGGFVGVERHKEHAVVRGTQN